MDKNHPWAHHILDVEVPAAIQYGQWGDRNHWLTLGYDLTGDSSLLRHAADSLLTITPETTFQAVPRNRNDSREAAAYFAILLPKVKVALTDAEWRAYEVRLETWANYMLANTHQGDSDEVVGHYFGLAAIDRAIGSSYLQSSSAVVEMMRSEIRRYIKLAAGGCWPESSEYNLGTLGILCMGAAEIGLDACEAEFPGLRKLLNEVTEHMAWCITPDFTDCVQWGDVQAPHESVTHEKFKWVALLGELIGLGCDPTGIGRAVMRKLLDGMPVNNLNLMLIWRALWCGFRPEMLDDVLASGGTFPPQASPIGVRIADQMGLIIHRTENSLIQIHMPPTQEWTDHFVSSFGDLRIWKDGEWVIDHPVGYGAYPMVHNVALMAGLGQMHRRAFSFVEDTLDLAGVSYGPRHVAPYYDPPPSFVEDWSRVIDLRRLVVKDIFKGTPPTRIDRYEQFEEDQINNRLGLLTQLWHSPVEPEETPDGFKWRLLPKPGKETGTPVRLVTNATNRIKRPDVLGDIAFDPKVTLMGNFHDGERDGWQIAFLSDENEVVIETRVLIGEEAENWTGVEPTEEEESSESPTTPPPPAELPLASYASGAFTYRAYSDRLEIVQVVPREM